MPRLEYKTLYHFQSCYGLNFKGQILCTNLQSTNLRISQTAILEIGSSLAINQ